MTDNDTQPAYPIHTAGHFSLNFGRKTHTVYPVKYMVVVGDLNSGFQFYGPFKDVHAADKWATDNLRVGMRCNVYPLFDVREDV